MKPSHRAAILLAIATVLTAAKKPIATCAKDLLPGATLSAEEELRQRLAPIQPFVTRQDGRATIEWSGIRDWIRGKSAELREAPARLQELSVSIYVNGEEKIAGLPFSTTSYTLEKEPRGQVDYYIVFKRGKQPVHISEFSLKETTDGQNILPGSFTNAYSGELLGFGLSEGLKRTGVRPELTRTAVDLGKKKIVWILAPSAPQDLRDFVASAERGVDVHAAFGASGEPGQVTVTDRASGRRVAANPKDFFFKVDAAFNGNSFFWDDMLVALATVPSHPWLARSTIDFWLMVQERNGGTIPREVRKENLISLWFPEVVKYGGTPRPNLTYTNPYLMNWVMDELFRYEPSAQNAALLERVSQSIEQYASWMEEKRAVRDAGGKLIGFNGSALGSGADNSRGRAGNAHENGSYQRAFIDFISQQTAMYSDLARWSRILAARAPGGRENLRLSERAARAAAKASDLKKLINERYWNAERGYYFDLVPDGAGGWKQDLRFTPIAGFWALYAGAASPAQVGRLIEMQMRPEAFGGDFPFPANARNSVHEGLPTDPMYIPRPGYRDEDGYWDKWAHWPPMMMVAVEGFRRSGRADIAHDLSEKLLKKIAESSVATVEESYGEYEVPGPRGSVVLKARPLQHASHPHRPDFAGWGKGPPIYMLLNHFLGLRPTYAPGRVDLDLQMDMPAGESFDIEHVIYNGGDLRLSVKRIGETSFEISAASRSPVDLKLSHAGRSGRLKFSGGGIAQKQRLELK